jgi:hypothetical protein
VQYFQAGRDALLRQVVLARAHACYRGGVPMGFVVIFSGRALENPNQKLGWILYLRYVETCLQSKFQIIIFNSKAK